MKAITIRVFKNDLYKNCSAGGISERYDTLYFICDDGYIDISDDNVPENTVVFVERNVGGKDCGYAFSSIGDTFVAVFQTDEDDPNDFLVVVSKDHYEYDFVDGE